MIDLDDKSLQCPAEGCPGVLDYIPTDGCFRCSLCDMEVWGDCGAGKVTTREAQEVYRLQQRTIDRLRKFGGGSKSAGRKRDKKKHMNANIYGVKPYWRGYDE